MEACACLISSCAHAHIMKPILVDVAGVRSLCQRAFARCKLNQHAAGAISHVIAAAERDGAKSHGLFRLPGFCAALLHGKVDPLLQPNVTDAAPSVVLVDGAGGFAPPAFAAGRSLLVAKAKSAGMATMAIRNACHFSALWFECEALASEGLISLACSSTPRRSLRILAVRRELRDSPARPAGMLIVAAFLVCCCPVSLSKAVVR